MENCLSKMELDRENSIVIGKMYHCNKTLIKDNKRIKISNKFGKAEELV